VYYFNQTLQLRLYWSETVTITGNPRIKVTIGPSDYYAVYDSEVAPAIFKLEVPFGVSDTNGIQIDSVVDLNGGEITDSFDNAATLSFTPPLSSWVLIDGETPVVISFTPPIPNTYKEGEIMDFNFQFSEDVVVTGEPRLKISLNTEDVWAEYVGGSGSNVLTFRFGPALGQEDLDGINVASSFDLNGGSITNINGFPIYNGFVVDEYPGIKVDAKAPEIISVTTDKLAYRWASLPQDRTISYLVKFSEPVVVADGVPYIPILIGASSVQATYVSGNNSDTLTFSYTIPETPANSLIDMDGVGVTPSIELNGAKIQDEAEHLVADLTFTPPATHYVYYSNILARYRFNDENVTLTDCGSGKCFSSVQDISGNNLGALTPSHSWGPVQGSGFAGSEEKFAQFNNFTYFNLPNLMRVLYITVVLKSETSPGDFTVLSDNYGRFLWFESVGADDRLYMSVASNSRRDAGFWQASTIDNYRSNMWSSQASSIYQLQIPQRDLFSLRLGESNFNGEVAEIIFWTSGVDLEMVVGSEARSKTLRNQLNSLYQAY
jgi:hypothetical protein